MRMDGGHPNNALTRVACLLVRTHNPVDGPVVSWHPGKARVAPCALAWSSATRVSSCLFYSKGNQGASAKGSTYPYFCHVRRHGPPESGFAMPLPRQQEPSRSSRPARRTAWRLALATTLTCACGQPTVSPEYSFRAPFEDINPFTGLRQINQWDLGGTAVAHRSFVRLTAEAQGSKGWMVSQTPLVMSEWSAMLEIRASGQSQHLYGDGLAIWIVKSHEHIEGPVFGREDKWKGVGLFFDTFQNIDHSHHHKHPYIYAVSNDGTRDYIPDAEKPDVGNQALPGAVDNSGCSYEFRYSESREDVTVLNHTRVHFTYKGKTLKLRLQQTSSGTAKEWYQCFEMKDVEIPNPAFFGVSAATGDLVDNHDIVQFVVRPLDGVSDGEADYDLVMARASNPTALPWLARCH